MTEVRRHTAANRHPALPQLKCAQSLTWALKPLPPNTPVVLINLCIGGLPNTLDSSSRRLSVEVTSIKLLTSSRRRKLLYIVAKMGVQTKIQALTVSPREAKVTTTREVQNRATDQQGSTTEASDQGSDPGGCPDRQPVSTAVSIATTEARLAAGVHLVPGR